MKLLLKHCDILAGDGEGYRYLADAYLSIDGSVIDYIGTEPPKAAYDREKDMTGKMLVPRSYQLPWPYRHDAAAGRWQ